MSDFTATKTPNPPSPEPSLKRIPTKLYMTYIVQHLYGRWPNTEFALKIISYNTRRSLKISWKGNPEKESLLDFLEVYQGSEIDENKIAQEKETAFVLPSGKIELIKFGFDFLILNKREIDFI